MEEGDFPSSESRGLMADHRQRQHFEVPTTSNGDSSGSSSSSSSTSSGGGGVRSISVNSKNADRRNSAGSNNFLSPDGTHQVPSAGNTSHRISGNASSGSSDTVSSTAASAITSTANTLSSNTNSSNTLSSSSTAMHIDIPLETIAAMDMIDDDFDVALTAELLEDDVIQSPHGRSITWYIHMVQWILLLSCISATSVLGWLYSRSWDVQCDKPAKLWMIVWLSRLMLQLINNLFITHLKLNDRRVPLWLLVTVRIVHVLGYVWVLFGFRALYYGPRCVPATWEMTVMKVVLWVTVSIYMLPFVLNLLLLLCLPLLIYFMLRFAVPPADRQPTPPSILTQLEVKSYRDIVDGLRRDYHIDAASSYESATLGRGMSSLSLTQVLDNVTALLVPPTTAAATSSSASSATSPPPVLPSPAVAGGSSSNSASASSGSRSAYGGRYSELDEVAVDGEEGASESLAVQLGRTRGGRNNSHDSAGSSVGLLAATERESRESGRRLSPKEAITINRACPICMVDMDDDDEVMVMPCDKRHFFHKPCVQQWLEGSQVCPICRSNIVNLLTGTPEDSDNAVAADGTAGVSSSDRTISIEITHA